MKSLQRYVSRHKTRLPAVRRADELSQTYIGSSTALRMVRDALANERNDETRRAIQARLESLERLEQSQANQDAEMERCKHDVVYWLANYVWTFDPRLGQPFLPFIPWEKQTELLRWLNTLEGNKSDGLIEKSRDQGATWLTAAYLIHAWLFRPGFKGSIASRKEDLLDRKGDPDSIFEKMRIAVRMLPWWMVPRGLSGNVHLTYLKLINPANGATITGEAGDNIGRGGRASMYVIDEAAFIPRPDLVERALSNTTDVRIYLSTPNGMGNPFYRKRFSGNTPVFTMHWKQDPRKNEFGHVAADYVSSIDDEGRLLLYDYEPMGRGDAAGIMPPDGRKIIYPWYERQRCRLNDEIALAQEVDIDYSASQEGVTIPNKWVRAAVNLELPRGGAIRASLDIADEGNCKNVLTIRQGPVVVAVYHWQYGNTSQTAWKAFTLAERHGAEHFVYDAGGGYGSGVKAAAQNPDRLLPFTVRGVNAGEPASEETWDGEQKKGKDRFVNIKAELWWKLRRRFEKTYEYAVMGIHHPLDELISIPDIPELIAELSSVQHFTNDNGKVQIESKKQMAKRGVKSPDFADSLVLSEVRGGGMASEAGGNGNVGVNSFGAPNASSTLNLGNLNGFR